MKTSGIELHRNYYFKINERLKNFSIDLLLWNCSNHFMQIGLVMSRPDAC